MNRRMGFGSRLGGVGQRVSHLLVAASNALGRTAKRLRLPIGSRGNRRRLLVRTSPGLVSAPHGRPSPRAVRAPRTRLPRVVHMRLFATWAAPFLLAMLAFAVPIVGVRGYEYVSESAYFQVHQVLVDGGPHISRDELVQLAGITPGMRVLGADVDTMAARLRMNPWIRSARVERELPDTLIIDVVEHVPAAYLAAGELWLVDTLGQPFLVAPATHAERLPMLTVDAALMPRSEDGSAVPEAARAAQLDTLRPALQAALNMAHIWTEMKLARRFPIGEIHIDGPRGYTIVLEGQQAGDATEVVLGRGPFREKLFRLEYVLESLRAQGKHADYVLLDEGDVVGPGAAKRAGDRASDRIGGARVVVKADLADDPSDALDDAIQPHPLGARPASRGAASPPRAPGNSAHDPQPDQPADGAVTPVGDDAPSDEPNEVVPLSGGRPAANLPNEPGHSERVDEENLNGQEH